MFVLIIAIVKILHLYLSHGCAATLSQTSLKI
jgi:hypothetical protein